VVGAIGDGPGSAYVFERHHGGTNNWGEVDKLTASDGVSGDRFGSAIDLSSNTILAGASADNSFKGSAYIFSITEFIYLPTIQRD
jgi:hypothetical protein